MVSTIEESGFEPCQGTCVLFFGKTIYSHSASQHPDGQMGTGDFNAGG